MEEYRLDPTIAYDVVELPSRGIHYANKKKSVRVAFLTATDEDILAAQNLAKAGGVVEEILKRKILDRDLPSTELVEEDRRAILIFLRNTAFGSEYNLTPTDPKTGEKFPYVADLSVIKMKEFTLVEDANGEYPFYMPKSEAKITFKFLNRKQQEEIDKLSDLEWNGNTVAPVITKQLEMMIKSVNDIREGMQIRGFINKMPIKDSQDFRKFVNTNKPGLDLTQKITTPSGEVIQIEIGFGVEFFRPFYGL